MWSLIQRPVRLLRLDQEALIREVTREPLKQTWLYPGSYVSSTLHLSPFFPPTDQHSNTQFDIHCHGLGGSEDVLDYWTNPAYTLSRLPKKGVTACLATLTFPGSDPLLQRSLKACRVVNRTIEEGSKLGALVYGIHAEGPIIATYGGLPNSDIISSKWSITSFRKLLDAIGKFLRVMTISPSLETGSYKKRACDEDVKEKTKKEHTCFTCSPTVSNHNDNTTCSCAPMARLKLLLDRGM
jgi:hypothetical protein